MDVCVRVWKVVPEGRLVVCSGRNQLELLTEEAKSAEELCDGSRSVELERLGRHSEHCVVGQESHDLVDITLLEGVDEAIHDLSFTLGVGQGHQVRVSRAPEPGAGTLEGAVNRRRCGLEHLRDLGCREAEHVAQDQGRSLLSR